MKYGLPFAITILVGLLKPLSTIGQTIGDTVELNRLYENLEPAELIAPALLGVGPSSVTKPSALKDISVDLIQSFAKFPKAGEGVGVEITPALFWRKIVLDKRAGAQK